MITLTLLHPIQSTPVQSWTFEHETVIRIGRSTDNHVILYSAVVSRHHVELRQVEDSRWEIINLGANGTYLNGKQITQVPLTDGVIIRLARSGPNIQIHLSTESTNNLSGETTLAQRLRSRAASLPAIDHAPKDAAATSDLENRTLPPVEPSRTDLEGLGSQAEAQPLSVPGENLDEIAPAAAVENCSVAGTNLVECAHQRATADMAFCPDCGHPLRVATAIGPYQVVKTLSRDLVGVTQLVWRENQSLLLRTLNQNWVRQPEALALFEQQAKMLLQLDHPGIPRFVDFFVLADQPYLVMEQVYGQDLHQRVVIHGPLSQAQAIAVTLQICDVLDYLHQQSPPLLHQDLKPSNLIQRSPSAAAEIKIAVTGFVSLNSLKIDTQPTLSGYISPEQQQGGSATPASDLFALGPTLVYLLTGKPPNQFYAQREQGFRFYPEYVPGLMPEMATVIRRLTNPKPEERYTTAQEVAAALSQIPLEEDS